MAHLEPLEYHQIGDKEIRSTIQNYEQLRGFVPNSIRTMARRPGMVKAFMDLNRTVLYEGSVDEGLKMLVSLATSLASGCLYCQSHMTNLSSIYHVPDEKIAQLLDYENSALFNDAEKAALTVAFKSAQVPNQVTEPDFDELKKYFNDEQIVEIVGTIALFGFLNRWNDTMATQVEMLPAEITAGILTDWTRGKHG